MTDRPFARNLRSLRAEHGYSKLRFARAAGVSPTCVSNWEAGKTAARPENLAAVARVLQTSPEALMGRAGAPAQDQARSALATDTSLREAIAKARGEIADLAGLPLEDVRVTLEYR